MASNAQVIFDYFVKKGLSPAAAAGIAGNAAVESSFNPEAYNANEGAIGIFQWEGGRRTALQSFAARTGGSETSLQTQLDFAWYELTHGEKGALSQIQHAAITPAAAAAAWDQYYERSAGTTRQRRESEASSLYGQYTGGYTLPGTYNPGGGPVGSGSGGGLSSDLGGASAVPTAADYSSIDGLKNLLGTVPELKALLDKAISTGQSTADFQDAVEASQWWKTHSADARAQIALKANDPAEFAKQQAQKAVQYTEQLKQLDLQYGHSWAPGSFQNSLNNLLAGNTTIDDYKGWMIHLAKSKYPGLASQLDGGLTLQDIANPYIQSMSNVLEINPQSVKVTDPLITKALQGMGGTGTGGSTIPQATPIWQFEQQLRSDPRWQYTQNAHQAVDSALAQIGKDFGFLG